MAQQPPHIVTEEEMAEDSEEYLQLERELAMVCASCVLM